ncbi:MAG: isocitrate lyase/PEP mutase family protein [Pseudomonadota bacterium]
MTTTTLKKRLQSTSILVAPGIADTLTGVLAQSAGFEAVFLSGSAMAFTHLGRPDIGLLTLGEVTTIAARINERIDIPMFIDADAGFGNAYHVQRTVRALEGAGASCIQIEDQVHDKHPTDIRDRPVIAIDDMQHKLRAALDARRNDATLISARSDAVFSEGVDAAIERAAAYAETGVDVIFVEGLVNADDRASLRHAIDPNIHLLFNTALPNGATAPDVPTLEQSGYSVALSPAAVVRASAAAVEHALAELATQSLPIAATRQHTPSKNIVEAIQGDSYIDRYQHWSQSDGN